MKKISIVLLGICLIASLSAQNPGDLDMSYGTNGISIPSFISVNYLKGMAIMTDDQLITGGLFSTGIGINNDLLGFKLRTDGTIAPFGGSTSFQYNLGYVSEAITAVFMLPDDKILLAGYCYDEEPLNCFVMRLLPDGSFDNSFGNDGIWLDESFNLNPKSIGVHHGWGGEYSIYVCGHILAGINSRPSIIKLGMDGNPAGTFGTDGQFVFSEIIGSYEDIYVYSFSGNGYIYAGGYDHINQGSIIVKQDIITGETINSFGTDGVFNFNSPTGTFPKLSSLVFYSDLASSTITAFGDYEHSDGDRDIFMLRIEAEDGSRDNSFGSNGWTSLRIPDSDEYNNDAIMQSDDKYYFGGYTEDAGESDFLIVRLKYDGLLDYSFGNYGKVITDISETDKISGFALNTDESRLYAGGYSDNPAYLPKATVTSYYTGFGVGISAPEKNGIDISVYPNPTNDIINIETGNDDTYTIEVCDLAGKLMMRENLSGKNLLLNVSEINEGMYLLKIFSGNITIQTSKIIIQ